MYFLAGAEELARWDKGDCHTPGATKSLVSAAPDPKFRLSAPTKEFVFVVMKTVQTVVHQ